MGFPWRPFYYGRLRRARDEGAFDANIGGWAQAWRNIAILVLTR
jgi:hypothetical protein